jgi:hypothetical protein
MLTFKYALLLALMGTIFSSPAVTAPQRERVVKKAYEGVEAVAIISVEVGGVAVKAGEKFHAGEEWLNGLKIKMVNASDKGAVGVIIELSIDQPGLQGVVYSIPYGLLPQSRQEASGASRKVRPNESLDVVLSGATYDGLKSLLAQEGYPATVEEISISVGAVFFEDFTLWRHGRLLEPSPDNPKKWSVVKRRERAKSAARTDRPRKGSTVAGATLIPVSGRSSSKARRASVSAARPRQQSAQCTAEWKNTEFLECEGTTSSTGGKCIFIRDFLEPQSSTKDAIENRKTVNCTQVAPVTCVVTKAIATSRANFLCDAPDPNSPVIVDTLGDGFSLTDAQGGVNFDLNSDGDAERISWTAADSDDALLALDRDGNGLIDDGTELFGNFTEQEPSWNPNGFSALAEFDRPERGGNGDGWVDKSDAIFPSLRLWLDTNHNGISESAELRSLQHFDVMAISVNEAASRKVDQYGNQFLYRAKVKDAKGAKVARWAYDVFLVSTP